MTFTFIVKLCYVKHSLELRLQRVSWKLANWRILFGFKSPVFHEVILKKCFFEIYPYFVFFSVTEDNSAVLVSILQKCRREKEKENVFMGFEIHRLPSDHEVR